MNAEQLKKLAAAAALDYIDNDAIVGVGTGSTVNFFIAELAKIKGKIEGAIASSKATRDLLKNQGIPVYDVNSVDEIHVYIDGTDEINPYLQCVKGGGGALTGEKILAAMAKQFICIADESKKVSVLGNFPLALEVIPLARSYVAREIVKMGADPVYRNGFITDYGNVILDIHNLTIMQPEKLEDELNNIAGVVTNGLFARRAADLLLLGTESGLKTIKSQ